MSKEIFIIESVRGKLKEICDLLYTSFYLLQTFRIVRTLTGA